jgi:hypothetical protein
MTSIGPINNQLFYNTLMYNVSAAQGKIGQNLSSLQNDTFEKGDTSKKLALEYVEKYRPLTEKDLEGLSIAEKIAKGLEKGLGLIPSTATMAYDLVTIAIDKAGAPKVAEAMKTTKDVVKATLVEPFKVAGSAIASGAKKVYGFFKGLFS